MNQTEALERMGFGVTRLPVAADGTLKVEDVEKAIRDDTGIVSIMWANNETGGAVPGRGNRHDGQAQARGV